MAMEHDKDSDDLVTLICSESYCTDPHEKPYDLTDITRCDLPSLLAHKSLKTQLNRNRLIEESSYFRGLLSGSFRESRDSVSIQWNVESFVNVLRIIHGCHVEICSDNFIPLNEAALFFGVDKLLVKCNVWLVEVTSSRGLQPPQLCLYGLIHIWTYGFEHANDFIQQLCTSYLARNFMWALSFICYIDIPYRLLYSCIEHPDLTIYSEKHLCNAILVWLAANNTISEDWSSNDLCHKINTSLLPLWFAVGKRRCHFFSDFADKSTGAILSLTRHPCATLTEVVREGDSSHLKVRLTKYTQKVDISGCPQITVGLFLLSLLSSREADSMLKEIINMSSMASANYGLGGLQISLELGQILIFEAVQELDISNCPYFSLESSIDCFCKSFPSLRTLRAAYFLNFKTKMLCQLVRKFPLLINIDLTLDINPVIPAQVSITASSSILAPEKSTVSFSNWHSSASLPSMSNIKNLTLEGRTDISGIRGNILTELMSGADNLKSLCLREIQLVDDALYGLSGSSLEMLDVSDTKVSPAALYHVICKNPDLKSLKTRGCRHLLQNESEGNERKLCNLSYTSEELYSELGKSCKLEELELGWGFSYFSLEALKPATRMLRSLIVGLGGSLGPDGLKLLPSICPILEILILYFQVISDSAIINLMKTLPHLQFLALCYCFGAISSLSFNVGMPNLKNLRLERVTPWMTNEALATLAENCANLANLSLTGCSLLDSESQNIISRGWPGLTLLHLEECGEITVDGVGSLLDCHALEDLTIRHNGSGIPKNFITFAASKLPMLRKISLDICDAKEGDFDIPSFGDRYFLSSVKIARCKLRKSSVEIQHSEPRRFPVHKESLVLVWNSDKLTRTMVKERL